MNFLMENPDSTLFLFQEELKLVDDKKSKDGEFFDNYDEPIDPQFLQKIEELKKTKNPVKKVKLKVSSVSAPEKLSEDQVFEIMKGYVDGATQEKLARKYGVSQSRISRALHGRVDSNRFTFDPDGAKKPAMGNELLFRALKLAISKINEAERELSDQKKRICLEDKLAGKTKRLKLERNENSRLRNRIKTLEDRLRKAKKGKK